MIVLNLVLALGCGPSGRARRPEAGHQPTAGAAGDGLRLVEVRDGYGAFYLRWSLPGEPVLVTDDPDFTLGMYTQFCPYEGGAVLQCERRGDDVWRNGRPAGVDLRSGFRGSLERLRTLGRRAQILSWVRAEKLDPAILRFIARSPVSRTLLSIRRFSGLDEEFLAIDLLRRRVTGLVLVRGVSLRPSYLSGFRNLRALHLEWVRSPTAVGDLSWLGRLEVLSLGHLTPVNLGALTPLVRLRRLRVLRIRNARVDTASLRHLAHLQTLGSLQLKQCHLGTAALAHLGRLHRLRYLDLEANNLSNLGLNHLLSLRHLRVLKMGWVDGSGLTDEGLSVVAQLRQLEGLSLAVDKRITNNGLTHLAPLVRLRDLDLSVTQVDDHGLVHLKPFKRLRRLGLTNTKVRGPGLAHLAPLQRLEVLRVHGLRAGGLKHLPRLARLRSLTINGGSLKESELVHLKRLPRLEMLRLALEKLNGNGLRHLAGLPLRYLSIVRTSISAQGLAGLAHLRGLRTLVLYSYQGPPQGLAVLARLKSLERLELNGDIPDEAMRYLSGLKRLRFLRIGSQKFQGSGVKHLQSLIRLRALHLRYTRATNEAAEHAEKLLGLREFTPGRVRHHFMALSLKEARPEVLVRWR